MKGLEFLLVLFILGMIPKLLMVGVDFRGLQSADEGYTPLFALCLRLAPNGYVEWENFNSTKWLNLSLEMFV